VVAALTLLYDAPGLPCLLALERHDVDAARGLLQHVQHELPQPFYAHFSPGLADVLGERGRERRGPYLKMTLRDLVDVDMPPVTRLTIADLDPLRELYARAYPGNWFDPRMLETGEYFGERIGGVLVGVAGIHVFSPQYGVAALGNITTDPAYRGQGIARRTTAALCRSLRQQVDTVSLNVAATNEAAIKVYESLGFEHSAPYEEWNVRASSAGPPGRR
jgi:ribosomal protein S18 acetylase RimI-like enzyme